MAVIREKRQFRNKRIGVVRMDTGESQMWQTVASAADSLTQQAFKQASIEAQNKGKEFAQSVGEESLRTIDPSTGKPQAYKAPSSFGTIAQAAFEETLDRRYIRTVEREIQDKANETYLKYEFDPQGVEKYSQVMEDYVGGMTKHADKRFEGIVRDTGAAYIASTKFNLLQKRNLRIKEAEQTAQKNDAKENASFIEAMAENVDWNLPDSQGHRDVEDMYREGLAGQQAARTAGLISDAQFEENVGVMRRALPKAILSKMINFDAVYEKEDGTVVQINSDVALAVENSLKTNRVLDDVPAALRTQVQRILDSEAYSTDRADLARHVTSLRTNLSLNEADVKKATEKELVARDIVDGKNVNSSKPVTRQAADLVVAQNTESLSGETRPDMIGYYSSPESLTNGALRTVITSGIIPESLNDLFDKVFNLDPMSNEQLAVALQHYELYSNFEVSGKPINALTRNGGITPEQDAFFRSLSFLTKTKGAKDIIGLASSLRSNYQNKDLVNDTLLRTFQSLKPEAQRGETVLNSYLSSKFQTDYQMKQMAKPLIEYMATSGMNFTQIDKAVNDMFDSTYVETEGLVIDRVNPELNKSMFSLARILPDASEQQLFISEVQLELNKRFPDSGFVFSKTPIGKDKNKIVKLVPVTTNAAVPDQVTVQTSVEGMDEPMTTVVDSFNYMAAVQDENGELKFLSDENGPVIVGTHMARDEIALQRAFAKGKEIKESEKQVQKKEKIKEKQQRNIRGLKGFLRNAN